MKKLLLVTLVTLSSCLSNQAKDNALMPAMELAWGNSQAGVRSDLERGIADALDDGDLVESIGVNAIVADLEDAISSGDRSALRIIPWASTLLPYAERGIQDRVDDGEMSDMIAESLRERLRNFTVGFGQLIAVVYTRPRERWLSNGSQVTPHGTVTLAGKLVPTLVTVD